MSGRRLNAGVAKPSTLDPTLRVGRNFIRTGDPIKVKPPFKDQFKSGWIFRGLDPTSGKAVVKDPATGFDRYVPISDIKRVAVTRGGVRKEVSK